jgi:hypothetical protein
VPFSKVLDARPSGHLLFAQASMFKEVDPAFAGKVREAGLPGLSPDARRDALTAGERNETSP